MSSRALGSLTLDLIVKTGAFVQGMTSAERQANKSLSAIEKRAYAFGQALGKAIRVGTVAAGAALGALAIAVNKAIDNADAIRDLSIRIGIGTETLSEYAYAARQTGTDIDGLGRGLKILAKNAAEAADATSGKGKLFEALGVNVKDAEGNLKQLDILLPEVADKFKLLEDGTTKAALAQELFGKSGLELTEFLNQGSKGLDDMAQKARALNIVISEDTAKAADEFNDQLGDLKAAGEGLSTQIAAELLPRLIELVKGVNQFVADGGNAVKIADAIGTAFDALSKVWGIFAKTQEIINAGFGTMIGLMASAVTIAQGLISLDFSKIGKGLAGGLASLQAGTSMALLGGPGGPKQQKVLLDPNRADFSGVKSRVLGQKTLEEQLADLFKGDGKDGKGGSKTRAAAKVDQLNESYLQLVATMKQEIALFGQSTEVAKLDYELKNGELSKLSEGKKQELLMLAQKIDSQKELNELQEAAAEASERESKRIQDALADNESLIDAMRFEYELLGLTNKERERELALRQLNVDATDEQKQKVAELADAYTDMQETISVMDDIRDGFSDFFSDVLTGTKSVKDAFKDMLDDIQKRILDRIAQNWVDLLFGQAGTSGGGASASGGTNWVALIASIFGGGRAAGGGVQPWKMYRVNETGMEGLTVDGKDYLMTGSKAGTVTPAGRTAGGGVTQVFNNPVFGSRNSAQQLQQEAGIKQRIAMGRNG